MREQAKAGSGQGIGNNNYECSSEQPVNKVLHKKCAAVQMHKISSMKILKLP